MAFESGVEPEDWRPAVIVPLYKGKGERIECKNCKSFSLLSFIDFIDLEKAYGRVNREALWGVLRMYDVRGIKSMYVDSSACVRVKGGGGKLAV